MGSAFSVQQQAPFYHITAKETGNGQVCATALYRKPWPDVPPIRSKLLIFSARFRSCFVPCIRRSLSRKRSKSARRVLQWINIINQTKSDMIFGQKRVDTFARLRGEGKHANSFLHIIDSLIRKPGAFENYRHRESSQKYKKLQTWSTLL